MDGRYQAAPFAGAAPATCWISPDAKVDQGVELHGPCFIDEAAVVKAGARVLPYSVIGRHTHVAEGAVVDGSIIWPSSWIGPEAVVRSSLVGRNCHIGRNVTIDTPVQLGDKTAITDYSRL
jgi:NDP-sugar pyrophosphorylase family protein